MRSTESIGLVASGNVSKSFISRLSTLRARLGPVKGVSFPSTRRLVISLGTGFAVEKYSDLNSCSAIWIVAPEISLDAIVSDLTEQAPIHRATVVVVCGTPRESTSFKLLLSKGARVATLNSIDEIWQTTFIAEGHRDALHKVRDILFKDKRRCIELDCGAKAKYLAGVHMVTELLRPWTIAAVELMCAAGFSRSEAAALSESLASRSLRVYGKIGVKVWPPSAIAALKAAKKRAEELRIDCPREAHLYAAGLQLALDYFDRGPRKHASTGHAK